jgi:hypothetical protein
LNREDIIRMAREADLNVHDPAIALLQRFAKQVAEYEREACADIAENWNSNGFPRTGVANEIRARGQA